MTATTMIAKVLALAALALAVAAGVPELAGLEGVGAPGGDQRAAAYSTSCFITIF